MIININESVFNQGNAETFQDLSRIIDAFLEKKCFINLNNCINIFFDENGNYIFDDHPFAIHYLSNDLKKRFKDELYIILDQDVYLTNVHFHYLSTINVGFDNEEIDTRKCLTIITLQSVIILENGTNDWKLIKCFADKFANHAKRKLIYKLIKRSIENNWLINDQAGGKGQIISRINNLISNAYSEIYKFKIATIFDSDRSGPDVLNNEIKLVIAFLKQHPVDNVADAIYEQNDLIIWHMLYKRELENYIPAQLIEENVNLGSYEKEFKDNFSNNSHLDFVKYSNIIDHKVVDVKNDFPALLELEFTKDLLVERCSHHKEKIELPNGTLEEVIEVEQILLKIAKLI